MRAAPIPGGVILHRREWLASGVSDRRLSGHEFLRVLPGHYTSASDPPSLNDICATLQRDVLPGAVVSHTTAALLLGIPLPHWLEGGIGFLSDTATPIAGGYRVPSVGPDASSRPDRRAPRSAGVRADGRSSGSHPIRRLPLVHCRIPPGAGRRARVLIHAHRLPPGRTVPVAGVTVSHPAEVLLELAALLPHDDLTAAVDAVIGPHRTGPQITKDELCTSIDSATRRRGRPALLAALKDSREGVESPGETFTRLLLVRAGFPEPTPNLPVWDPVARSMRRIDNGYEGPKIGVEYDGGWRRTTTRQWRLDEARSDNLASIGWILRRLTMDDLYAPADFLDRLHAAFLAHGITPPPRSRWHGERGSDLGRRVRSGPHLVG